MPEVIRQLLDNLNIDRSALEAIAVSDGPGSYTGLRIGTATGKGLCSALEIPLISINSLDIMIEEMRPIVAGISYIAPMIDARRMEVYMKLVDKECLELRDTQAVILSPDLFINYVEHPILLIGDGVSKCEGFIDHPHLNFAPYIYPRAQSMGPLAFQKFKNRAFENLQNFEPNYFKEFHTRPSKNPFNNL
tara:strand:- start:119 stop:691 length:573 start_codon:yes stop_codon:yes gene_type:complete